MRKRLADLIPFITTKVKLRRIIDEAVTKAIVEEKEFKDIDALEAKRFGTQSESMSYTELALGVMNREVMSNFKAIIGKMKPKRFWSRGRKLTDSETRQAAEAITREKGWVAIGSGSSAERTQELNVLRLYQDSVFKKAQTDPHCKNVIDAVQRYTIGRGIKFDCENRDVLKVMRGFWDLNLMERRQKRMVNSTFMEGEYFLAHFISLVTGRTKVRKMATAEIDEIETSPDDIETKLAYKRLITKGEGKEVSYRWYPDINYFAQLKDEIDGHESAADTSNDNWTGKEQRIQFIKYGYEDETRGRVPMAPVLHYLQLCQDWITVRMGLNWHRGNVVWIKTIKGRSGEATTRIRKPPKGNTVLVETENTKYRIEAPKLDSADALKDYTACLHMVGSGVSMPLFILDQNADTERYASIRKADTPFSQFILDNQDFWSIEFDQMFRAVIRASVDATEETLPDETKVSRYSEESVIRALKLINEMKTEGKSAERIIKEAKNTLGEPKEETIRTVDIPISLTFPQMVYEDPKAMAEVLKIHQELGIVSQATLTRKAGYDWQYELTQMLKEQQQAEEIEEERVKKFGKSEEEK